MVLLSVHLIGLVLFALCTCHMVSASQGSYPSKNYRLTHCGHGVVSSKNIIAEMLVGSKGECAMECTREDSCTSFNIQMPSSAGTREMGCQLATGDKDNCTEMTDDPQYDNYQVTCYQGIFDDETKRCKCIPGWGGTKCQKEKCCNFKADANTILLFNFDQMAEKRLSFGNRVHDESLHRNDGTVYGSGAEILTDDSACVSGYRITDRNSILITDSTSLSPSTALTIEVWTKPAIFNAGYLIFKTYSYGLKFDDNYSRLFLYGTNGNHYHSGASLLDRYTDIMYIAGTFDGNQIKLYVNGTLMSTKPHTQPINDEGYKVKIGQAGFNQNHFDGMIYAIRLSNVARTASEIKKTSESIGGIWCPRG